MKYLNKRNNLKIILIHYYNKILKYFNINQKTNYLIIKKFYQKSKKENRLLNIKI